MNMNNSNYFELSESYMIIPNRKSSSTHVCPKCKSTQTSGYCYNAETGFNIDGKIWYCEKCYSMFNIQTRQIVKY